MHNAPSVVYPVGRSAWMGRAVLLLAGTTLGAGVFAGFTANASPWSWLTLLLPWLLWCGWAWRGWWRSPGGWLHWQGQARRLPGTPPGQWRWQTELSDAGVELATVEPVFDLQVGWLLRLGGAAGVPRWVCVEAASDPAHWPALRRALTAARQRVR